MKLALIGPVLLTCTLLVVIGCDTERDQFASTTRGQENLSNWARGERRRLGLNSFYSDKVKPGVSRGLAIFQVDEEIKPGAVSASGCRMQYADVLLNGGKSLLVTVFEFPRGVVPPKTVQVSLGNRLSMRLQMCEDRSMKTCAVYGIPNQAPPPESEYPRQLYKWRYLKPAQATHFEGYKYRQDLYGQNGNWVGSLMLVSNSL